MTYALCFQYCDYWFYRKYAASFICENLLDGSSVAVGQQFVKYWVLKNEGTITWDDQIQVESGFLEND